MSGGSVFDWLDGSSPWAFLGALTVGAAVLWWAERRWVLDDDARKDEPT